jgi:hypothetical protein
MKTLTPLQTQVHSARRAVRSAAAAAAALAYAHPGVAATLTLPAADASEWLLYGSALLLCVGLALELRALRRRAGERPDDATFAGATPIGAYRIGAFVPVRR